MTRRTRTLFIALCVIVGLIVVASVVLRLILTRDRLMALVVPRIEKRVGAEIGFGDIGIRFPFGFGVDVSDLTFDKPLPDGSQMRFSAGTVTVRASLISLIKRKPEINAIDVENADVKLTGTPRGIDILLEGMKSTISIKPSANGFSIKERIEIDALSIVKAESGATLPLGKIMVRGDVDADAGLNSLIINELEVRWADMLSALCSGEVSELSGAREFSITLHSEDIAIASLLDWIKAKPIGDLVPKLRNTLLQKELPVELAGGTMSIDVSATGSAKNPAGIEASGTVTLNDLSVEHALLKDEALVNGGIVFSKRDIRAKNFTAAFGDSKVSIDFDIKMSEDGKPERISFESESEVDLDDIAFDFDEKGVSASGKVTVRVEGGGTPQMIFGLFPSAGKEVSPERIENSWKRFSLNGTVRASEVNVSSKKMPLAVSSLAAEAEIQHGDIKSFKADFRLDGSPFSCTGSMLGIMPAFAELASIVEKANRGEAPPSLGEALDGAYNAPDISLNIMGKSFDVRPFQELSKAKKEGKDAEMKKTGAQEVPGGISFAYNPASAILMKSTSFFVRVDSIVTEKAVFTSLYAKGTIRDGRMSVTPLLLNYANGKGRGSFRANFRNPPDIKSDIIFSFKDIEAGRVLGDFSKLGDVIDGTFTLKTDTEFASGPGVNTLMSMNATGSTVSSMGRIDISSLLAPLKGFVPLDLSPIEKSDFHDWSGNFKVIDGRLMTDDWRIKSSKANWLIKGSYGFDGTLDFGIRLAIPPVVQKEMKDLRKYGDLVTLFQDAQGNLVLDFHLGGTAKSPKISLDASKAGEKTGDNLINDFMKKARDMFKK